MSEERVRGSGTTTKKLRKTSRRRFLTTSTLAIGSLAFRVTRGYLRPFRTATRGPVQSSAQPSSGEPEFSTRPLEKFSQIAGATAAMGPSRRSAGEGPRHRRQGPNQTKSARARSSMPNVSCWGISGRTGDMAGESVVAE